MGAVARRRDRQAAVAEKAARQRRGVGFCRFSSTSLLIARRPVLVRCSAPCAVRLIAASSALSERSLLRNPAAPATMTQYVWAGDAVAAASREITLARGRSEPLPGGPVNMVLTQPQSRATALFVFRQHGALIGHHVAEVRAGTQEVALRLPPGTQGPLSIGVHIRDRDEATDAAPGFLPYGTPCSEIADPVLARLCELEREIERLRNERRGAQPKAKSA